MIDTKFKQNHDKTHLKGVGMKYILAAMLLASGAAYAGPLEFCNKTSADSNNQASYQTFNAYRGQVVMTGTGLAPSVTLPALRSGMRFLRIDFQNRTDYQTCLDAASPNNWCGTNPPTTTVSNTAWVFKPASLVVLAQSSTIPTTMYVSGTGTVGYSMCGQQ